MIYLRPLTIKDANRLFEIKSNPNNFNKKFTNFDTENVTLIGINQFLKNIINEVDAIRLGICIKKENILIGSITLGNINYNSSCCELHIYIDIKYQNMGCGKSSLKRILNYINYVLNLNTVTLKVHKEHYKAVNLYKKTGFNISSDSNDSNDNDDFLNMYLTFK